MDFGFGMPCRQDHAAFVKKNLTIAGFLLHTHKKTILFVELREWMTGISRRHWKLS